MNRKHGLLLFLSTCIPGGGQMYQGYMKRGGSLLGAFFALFTVAVFLELEALAFLLIPIWLYSFFDSYNLRSLRDAGAAAPDQFLFGLSSMDSQQLARLCRTRHSLIGWTLVALGGYSLFKTSVGNVLGLLIQRYDSMYWLYEFTMYDLPRMAVTVLIILLGVWFIRGPKAPREDPIPPFIPQQPEPSADPSPDGDPQEAPHGEL